MSRTVTGRTLRLIRALRDSTAKDIRAHRVVALESNMCYTANCTVCDGIRIVMNVTGVLPKCSMRDAVRGDTHLLKHGKLAINTWQ